MSESSLLMIPGPVPTSEEMRSVLSDEMINHRGEEFKELFGECQEFLQQFFGTQNDIVIVSGSGTAAMEMAVSNVVGTNETVVCIYNGTFGERFEEITQGFTSSVRSVNMGWGESFDLARIEEAIDESVDVVTMVHAETSVGLVNPAKAVGKIAKEHDAVFIVDCITSVGCETVKVDEWGIDLAVTASQKAIGAPPGLSAIAVSDHAKSRLNPDVSSYYLDLASHIERAKNQQTPTTCSVPLYRAFHHGLRHIDSIGLGTAIHQHARFSGAIRAGLRAMGMSSFPTVNEVSALTNGVVVAEVPRGLNASEIVGGLEEQGVIIKTGLGPATDDTVRIGIMGAISEDDVLRTIRGLESVLGSFDHQVTTDPVNAARSYLNEYGEDTEGA